MNFKVRTLIVVSLVSIISAFTCKASANDFDWNKVINAIVKVESRGNTKAVNGIYCGPMQISPVLVKECNNILAARKDSRRFTLKDRFNLAKSKEMFRIIMSWHNPSNNIEHAIRLWNGGLNYSRRKTQRYYLKVMANM